MPAESCMTLPTSKRQANGNAPDSGGSLRLGQVYLDVRRRNLACLNQAARQLYNDGVPFLPEDLGRRPVCTAEGRELTADDLPLIVAWREKRPVEASFTLAGDVGLAW